MASFSNLLVLLQFEFGSLKVNHFELEIKRQNVCGLSQLNFFVRTMNRLFWRFLECFFKFQNIICFDIKEDKISKLNWRLIIFSIITSNLAFILSCAIVISGHVQKFVLIENINLKDVSVLMTRLIRLFPALLMFSNIMFNFFILNYRKTHRSAKLFMRIKILANVDLSSDNFKKFESRSLVIFLAYYSFLMFGHIVNVYSTLIPSAASVAFVLLLFWNMYTHTHIIFLYVMCIDFVSIAIIQLEKKIIRNEMDLSIGLHKMYRISQTLDRIRLNVKTTLLLSFMKVLADMLIRVRIFF